MELWNERSERIAQILPDLVAEAEKKVPYASILMTYDKNLRIQLEGGTPAIAVPPGETGVVMSVFDGACMREYATNELDADKLAGGVREFLAGVTVAPVAAPLQVTGALTADYRYPWEIDPLEVPLRSKLEMLYEGREAALRETAVKHTVFRYSESRITKLFVSRGCRLRQELSFVGAHCLLYAGNGTRTRYSRSGDIAAGGYELVRRYLNPATIADAGRRARALLRAEPVPPGRHTIITAPLVSGIIAHEAFGHGVELDMFLKDCARARDFMGRQVAAPMVDMFDEPRCNDSSGFYYFDDEGLPSRKVQIIDRGILINPITDLYSASILGYPRTPNGRRESFRRKIYSRMSNTYIAAGDQSFDQLLAGVDQGIYLYDGGSGMEDPLGWGIQIDIQAGEEIRHGRLTGRVFSPIVLTGYVPDLLKSIRGVGADFSMHGLGRCGKTFRKDWILVGSGGPHLLMEGRLA